MKDSVRIVVVGDEGVGKTSIIEVLITNHFESVVQPVLPVVVVPEDATPEHVHVSIVDTPGGPSGLPKVNESVESADVVVLVYSVDDLSSIENVKNVWLKKFREAAVSVPIILVGNKIDLRGGIADPRASENMEAFIKPIMDNYREVEVCIECSAKTVSNIPEVFYFAQKAVLHPTSPLYNVDTHQLTDGAAAALRRIFTMCDNDRDGALNDTELNDFQYKCFSIHLAADELEGVKRVVKESRPENGLTEEGYLSCEGFLYLHMLFVQKGRLETTWIVLRKFGYSDDLRLSLDDADAYTRSEDQSAELAPAAVAFLSQKFSAADADGDGLLSPAEVVVMFQDCPDGPFPAPDAVIVDDGHGTKTETDIREETASLWPQAATVTKIWGAFRMSPERNVGPQPDDPAKAGYLTPEAHLARWSMLLQESPESVMLTLKYLGYNEPPLSAIKTTKPRKRDRYARTVSRSVFKVAVIGDPEVSRADIVRCVAGVKSAGVVSPGVACAAELPLEEAFGGGSRTLVMRDVAETGFAELFGSRRELESLDVMCIVFNHASMESMEQAMRVYEGVQNKAHIIKIPVILVSCQPTPESEALQEVADAIDAFCAENNLVAPIHVSPRENEFGDLYSQLVSVCARPNMACPDYYEGEEVSQGGALATALKVVIGAAVIGGCAYGAKLAYDYFTKPKASS